MNTKDYLVIMSDVLDIMCQTSSGREALIESKALDHIFKLSLQIVGENVEISSLAEKQVAMTFIVNVWRVRPELIEDPKTRNSDQIIAAIKAGCRDMRSISMRTTSINLMFSLLYDFTKEKNASAPTIYKALVFLLIDLYRVPEFKEEVLKNFVALFTTQQQIPI